jgi:3-deoxy-manno-octulosonate cytidylyltransferase (CMP-KDO synthetase)
LRQGVFHHIGVYAYRPNLLARWVGLPPIAEERDERLEQLRPLAHGMSIGVALLREPPPPGVDTEDDLRAVERQMEVLTGG